MTAQLLNGKDLATQLRQDLAAQISALPEGRKPGLAILRVGDNEASKIYVKSKKKAADEVGIFCEEIELSASIGENALIEVIHDLNDTPEIDGIIVQLPLPSHLNELKILSAVSPSKDVDGFSPVNKGLLSYNTPEGFVPATPQGILALLNTALPTLSGKNVVIIGRSNIVGKPLASLLLNQNCTVTLTHSKTLNLPEITKQADIVVAACGRAKMVTAEWIKDGAVVIDVGINRIDGKICGDVDFESVRQKASYLTPVPGGVGPMTVAQLLLNTFKAFSEHKKQPKHCCQHNDSSHNECTCSHDSHHSCHCKA